MILKSDTEDTKGKSRNPMRSQLRQVVKNTKDKKYSLCVLLLLTIISKKSKKSFLIILSGTKDTEDTKGNSKKFHSKTNSEW